MNQHPHFQSFQTSITTIDDLPVNLLLDFQYLYVKHTTERDIKNYWKKGNKLKDFEIRASEIDRLYWVNITSDDQLLNTVIWSLAVRIQRNDNQELYVDLTTYIHFDTDINDECNNDSRMAGYIYPIKKVAGKIFVTPDFNAFSHIILKENYDLDHYSLHDKQIPMAIIDKYRGHPYLDFYNEELDITTMHPVPKNKYHIILI